MNYGGAMRASGLILLLKVKLPGSCVRSGSRLGCRKGRRPAARSVAPDFAKTPPKRCASAKQLLTNMCVMLSYFMPTRVG
jgi:hypothetical protein